MVYRRKCRCSYLQLIFLYAALALSSQVEERMVGQVYRSILIR